MNIFIPFLTGLLSIFIQTFLIREYLVVFRGNELLIGLFFLVYFFGWACGGAFNKIILPKIRDIRKFLLNLILVYLIWFLFSFLYLHIIVSKLEGTAGKVFSLTIIFSALLSGIFPLTFLNALIFGVFTYNYKESWNPPGKVYLLDGLGGFTGGVIFSFILVHFANIPMIIMFTGLILAIMIKLLLNIKLSVFNLIMLLACVLAFLLIDLKFYEVIETSGRERTGYSDLFLYKNTPYANYTGMVNDRKEMLIFRNGAGLFAQGWSEWSVYKNDFIINLHPKEVGKEILILGLPDVQGLNRFREHETTIVFRDKILKKIFKEDLFGLNVVLHDPRDFLKRNSQKYDEVWVTFSEPLSMGDNRFFTVEFFNLVKSVIREDGLIFLNITGSENYLSWHQERMLGIIYHTLKNVFPIVRFSSGDEFLFISSLREFEFNPETLIETAGDSPGFNPLIFKIWIKEDREDYFLTRFCTESAEINSDINPVLFIRSIMVWGELNDARFFKIFSLFLDRGKFFLCLFICLIILLSVFTFIAQSRDRISSLNIQWSLLTTGITAISFELLCIYLFQVNFGNIYEMIGLLTGIFLLGISIGAFTGLKVNSGKERWLLTSEFSIVFLCILGFSFSGKLHLINSFFSFGFISLSLFLIGFFSGLEFPVGSSFLLSSKKRLSESVSALLVSDMTGAMIGSFMIPLFLLPVLGIRGAFGIISLVNISSFMVLALRMILGRERRRC